MKTIIALLLVLVAGCTMPGDYTLNLTEFEEHIGKWEHVEQASMTFQPKYKMLGLWDLSVEINHPTCGRFRVKESGQDPDKLYKIVDERIRCLNACK